MDLEQPANFHFLVNFGNNNQPGADGMAFVIQDTGTGAIGSAGGGLGLPGNNYLAAIFNTYNGNTSDDTFVLRYNGGNLFAPINIGEIEDGDVHAITFDWNPITMTLTTWLDLVPIHTQTGLDAIAAFGGDTTQTFGWTAGTGGEHNRYSVCFENLRVGMGQRLADAMLPDLNVGCIPDIDQVGLPDFYASPIIPSCGHLVITQVATQAVTTVELAPCESGYERIYRVFAGCSSQLVTQAVVYILQGPPPVITAVSNYVHYGCAGDQRSVEDSFSGLEVNGESVAAVNPVAPLIISGVVDGPLPSGRPKMVEFTALEDIPDLSIFGFGAANNGGGTDGQEFTFPADALLAGQKVVVTTPTTGNQVLEFFGEEPDYIGGAANINGDDAIELFMNGMVIDVFGEIDTDGTGEPWEYMDGWAYRKNGTGPDGSTFVLDNWIFSGPNALDNETSNATADTPYPYKSYTTPLVPFLAYEERITNECDVVVKRTWRVEDCCHQWHEREETYAFSLTDGMIMNAFLPDLALGCIPSADMIPPPNFIDSGTMESCGDLKILPFSSTPFGPTEVVLGSVTQDFDSAGTVFGQYGSAAAPVPAVTGNAGQLTPASNSQFGRIAFEQVVPGDEYDIVRGQFDFRAQPGGVNNQADGLSIVLLDTASSGGTTAADFSMLSGTPAEHGRVPNGLGIGINIHQGGSDISNNSIYFSSEVGGISQSLQAGGPFDLSTTQFHRLQFELAFQPGGGALANLTLIEDINGTPGAPIPLVIGQFIPGITPYDARVGFAGRTGGQNALQQIDNIQIDFIDADPRCVQGLERVYEVSMPCVTNYVTQLVTYTINTAPPQIVEVPPHIDYDCTTNGEDPRPLTFNTPTVIQPTVADYQGNVFSTYVPENLVNGSGLSGIPEVGNINTITHAGSGSGNSWVTLANIPNYYDRYGVPVLTLDLGELVSLTDFVAWNYSIAGNAARQATLSFSADGPNGIFSQPVTLEIPQTAGNAHILSLGQTISANAVQISFDSNWIGFGDGGDRVGLNEIRFLGGTTEPGDGFVVTDPDGDATVVSTQLVREIRSEMDCKITVQRLWRVEDCCNDWHEAWETYSYIDVPPDLAIAELNDVDLGCVAVPGDLGEQRTWVHAGGNVQAVRSSSFFPAPQASDDDTGTQWVTDDPAPGGGDFYVDENEGDPVLIFDLGSDRDLAGFRFWNYSVAGNRTRDFTLRFATETDGPLGAGESISASPSFRVASSNAEQHFYFERLMARYVEMTITDNYFGITPAGGDRVGLAEMQFLLQTSGTYAGLPAPATEIVAAQSGCATELHWVDDYYLGTDGCVSSNERIYVATDICGNSHTVTQLFTYIQNTAPPEITEVAPTVDFGCEGDQRQLEITLNSLNGLADGVFPVETASGTVNTYVESHNGEGWLLVGRGREGWEFDADGPGNESLVPLGLGTSTAFTPAGLTDSTINDLLARVGTDMSNVEIRLKRAVDRAGIDPYQEVRWRMTGRTDWSWDFDADTAAFSVQQQIVSGPNTHGAINGNTRDISNGNNYSRVFTWLWNDHNSQGFSYGDSVNLGLNNGFSFLWQNGNERHAIPYAEVYIRLVNSTAAAGAAPDPTYQGDWIFTATDPDGDHTILETNLVSESRITNDCKVTVYRTWEVIDCCENRDEALEIYQYSLTPIEIMNGSLDDLDVGCVDSVDDIPGPDVISPGTMAECGAVKIQLDRTQAYATVISQGTFSGGDVGEGLDLDGDFLMAVNVYGPGGYQVRDALFLDEAAEPNFSITDDQEILNWQNPNFGATANDDNLEVVMQSIRWGHPDNGSDLDIDIAQLEPGRRYKLQLLFYEPDNLHRGFDIYFEGTLALDDFTAGVGNGQGAVATYEFIATDSNLDVLLLGQSGPFVDDNPVLQAITLEQYDIEDCETTFQRVYEVATECSTQMVTQTITYVLNTEPPRIVHVAPYVDYGCDGDQRALVANVPDGLQTFFSFNEIDAGGSVADDWGGHTGDLIGGAAISAPGTGRSGQSYDRALDLTGGGAASLHLLGDAWSGNAVINNKLTISFWQQDLDPFTDSSDTSFRARSPGASCTDRGALAHSPWGDGTLYWDTRGCDNAARRLQVAAPLSSRNNGWHHYAYVKDGDYKAIYVDGALIASSTSNEGLLPFTELWIGSEGGANSLNGLIDDFNVWDSALDGATIAFLASGADLLPDPTYGGTQPFVVEDGDDNAVLTQLVNEVRITNDCHVTVTRTWRVEDCCGEWHEADETYAFSLLLDDINVALPSVDAGCIDSLNELPLAGVGDVQVIHLAAMGDNPVRYNLPVIDGLAMWFDAEDPRGDGAYLPDGTLSTWIDKSPFGNDLFAVGGSAPELVRSTLNDRPVVRFDVADYLYRAANVQGWNADDVSIFYVTRNNSINDNYFFEYQGTGGNRHSVHHPWSDNNVYWDWGVCCSSPNRVNVNQAGNVGQFGVWNLFNNTVDGKAIVFNGLVQAAQGFSTSPIDPGSPFALGANESGGQGWGGDVAEFIVFNRRLTPDETQDVGAYLAAKYGIPTAYSAVNPLDSDMVATPCEIDSVTLVGTVPVGTAATEPVLLPPPVVAIADSVFNQNYLDENLFDGNPVLGSGANLGRDYATALMDTPSVHYWDFGAVITANGFGYAQRATGGLVNDKVQQMEFWFLDTDPGGPTVPASPPDAVVDITELAPVFTAYSLGQTLQGRYVIARFTGNEFYPGGLEFRFANSCGSMVDRLYEIVMGCNTVQAAQRVSYVERGPVPQITEVAPFEHYGCNTDARSLLDSLERLRFTDPSGDPVEDQFYSINTITTSTSGDFYPLGNLIQGPGVGFADVAPYEKLLSGPSGNWVTSAPGGFPSDYIAVAGMPVLVLDLGTDVPLSEISIWGYDESNGNGVREFSLRFATSAEGTSGFGSSIAYNPTFLPVNLTTPRQSFAFGQEVTARYVEFTCVDNDFGNVVGGDRVGLGEIAFRIPGSITPQFVRGPFLVNERREQIGCDVIVRRTWRIENCCGDWHEMEESFAYTAPPVSPSLNTLDSFAPGVYAIDDQQGGTIQLRVTSDGDKNWLLVGRGREGWDFDADGPGNESAVPWDLGTPDAFTPAALTDGTINAILAEAGLNATQIEIRLRRAADPQGAAYQDLFWRLQSQTSWSWNFSDGPSGGYTGFAVEHYVPDETWGGPYYILGSTEDLGANDQRRVFTWAWDGHNLQQGFSYGSGVNNGSDSGTSFLWEFGNEQHAIPYTEVYIRSLEDQAAPPGLAVSQPMPLHLGCISTTDQIPPLDLTMLGVTSACPWQVWKVASTDPVLTTDGCTWSNQRAFVVGTDCETVKVWQAVTWILDEGAAEVVEAFPGTNWGCQAEGFLPPTNYDAIVLANVATSTIECITIPLGSQSDSIFVQGAQQLTFPLQADSFALTGGDAGEWDLSGSIIHAIDFQNNAFDRTVQGVDFEWYIENPQVDITTFNAASCLGNIGDFGDSINDEELRHLAGNLLFGSAMNISYQVPTGRMVQVDLISYSGNCGGRWQDVMLNGEEVFDNAFAPANPNGALVLRVEHCAFDANHNLFMGSAGTFGAANPGPDNNAVIGGMIIRDIGPCIYAATGTFDAGVSKVSSNLWRELAVSEWIPADTDIRYTVSNAAGTVFLSSAASVNGVVDLSAVPVAENDIRIRVEFSTADETVTPKLFNMAAKSGRPIANIDNPFLNVSDRQTTNGCDVTVFRTLRADGCCGDFHERLEIHTYRLRLDPPEPERFFTYVGCINDLDAVPGLEEATLEPLTNGCEHLELQWVSNSPPRLVPFDDFVLPVSWFEDIDSGLYNLQTNGCLTWYDRIYMLVDSCGQSAQLTQTVAYTLDQVPPQIVSVSNHVDYGCEPEDPRPIATSLTAVVVEHLDETVPGTQAPYVVELQMESRFTNDCYVQVFRTWRVEDCCGSFDLKQETYSYIQQIDDLTVEQLPALNLTCINNRAEIPLPDPDLVEAASMCPLTDIEHLQDGPETNEGCVSRFVREYLVTDQCGATAVVTQAISYIVDQLPPVIESWPADTNLGCQTALPDPVPGADLTNDIVASDDSLVVWRTNIDTRVTNNCEVTVTRRWMIRDCCDRIDERQTIYTFTIRPSQPGIEALADKFVGCITHTNQLPEPNFTLVTASSACSVVTLDYAGPQNAAVTGCTRSLERVYIATDLCGQSNMITQTISWIIEPDQPEILTWEADRDWGCQDAGWRVPVGTNDFAADHTTGPPTWTDLYTTNGCSVHLRRTWRVENCCYFTTVESDHWFTLRPSVATIEALAPLDVGCIRDIDQIPQPNETLLSISSACNVADIFFYNHSVVTNTGCTSSYERVYRVQDICGQSSFVTQDVSWVLAPTHPEILAVEEAADWGCRDEGWIPPVDTNVLAATGYVGEVSISDQYTTNGCLITLLRTFEVVNCCGDTDHEVVLHTWTVRKDGPTVQALDVVDLGCLTDAGQVPGYELGSIEVLSGCPGASVSFVTSTAPVNVENCLYEFTRAFRAIDLCRQQHDFVQTIRYRIDNEAPTIFRLPGGELACAAPGETPTNLPTFLEDIDAIDAVDDCTVSVTFVEERIYTNDPCRVELTRNFRINDPCGNFVDRQITYTWMTMGDAPVISGTTRIGVGCINSTASVPRPDKDALSVSGSCEIVEFRHLSDGPHVLSTNECIYSFERIFIARDACDQVAWHTQLVFYSLLSQPEITRIEPDEDIGCVVGGPSLPVEWSQVVYQGNIPSTGRSVTTNILTNGCMRTLTRTYRIEDCCGYIDEESVTFTWIAEPDAASISGPTNIEFGCFQNAWQVPAPNPYLFTISANCGGTVTYVGATPPVTNGCDITQVRTYHVTDVCNRVTPIEQTIHYSLNAERPSIVSLPHGEDFGCLSAAPDIPADTNVIEVSGTQVSLSYSDWYRTNGCLVTLTRVWRVDNCCGESDEAGIDYTWIQPSPPILTPPAGFVYVDDLGCNPTLSTVPVVDPRQFGVESTCGTTATVYWAGDEVSFAGCTGVLTRTYTASDTCGNYTSVVQTFTFREDTQAPTNITINAGGPVPCGMAIPNPDIALVSVGPDNCEGNIDITVDSVSTSQVECAEVVTHTYRISDACGNDRLVPVYWERPLDNEAPVVTCVETATVETGTDCYAPVPEIVPEWSDSCGDVRVQQIPKVGSSLPGPSTQDVTVTVSDACGNSTSCVVKLVITSGCGPGGYLIPDIAIEKTVYLGHDGGASCASAGESVTWTNGTDVTWCFRIYNTGQVELHNVRLIDPQLGMDQQATASLLPGDNTGWISADWIMDGSMTNVAHATGLPVNGRPVVQAEDPAEAHEIDPPLMLLKTVRLGTSGDGGSCPGSEFVEGFTGDPVVYCFEIINTSDNMIENVWLRDDLLGIDLELAANLGPGQRVTYSAPGEIAAATTNTAWASGEIISGPMLGAIASPDDAEVDVGRGKITGTVWEDLDDNGRIDPNDNLDNLGISDATVSLYEIVDGQPVLVSTTVSGPNGAYAFNDLPAGDYSVAVQVVTVVLPSDADETPIRTTPVGYSASLDLGECIENYNFGFRGEPTAVSLTQLDAIRTEGGVVVTWTVGSQTEVLGYRVSRDDVVLSELIPARGLAGTYAFTVADAVGGRYKLDAVGTDLEVESLGSALTQADASPAGDPSETVQAQGNLAEFTSKKGVKTYFVYDFDVPPAVIDLTRECKLIGQVIEVDGRYGVYFSPTAGVEIRVE